MKTKPMPPVLGVVVCVAVFLGILFGSTLIYEGQEVLGVALLIAAATLVVLLVIWTIRARTRNPDG